jgi:hypothetical protein
MSKGDPETLRNMPEEALFLVDYTFKAISAHFNKLISGNDCVPRIVAFYSFLCIACACGRVVLGWSNGRRDPMTQSIGGRV